MKLSLLKTPLAVLLILALSNGCSPKGNDSSFATGTNFITQVVDSVSFDFLSDIELLDYNNATGEFLVKNKQGRSIFVVDGKGELVSEFNPYVQGPSYVGDNDFDWVFYGEEDLLCYSTGYFYQMTKEGERVRRVPYPVETAGLWMLDYNPEMIFTYSVDKRTKVVSFITESAGPRFNTQAFQDSVDMVYRMDFDENLAEAVMQKQKDGVYRSLGDYVDRGWPYMTHIKGSLMAQTYFADSSLYIFDVETNTLVNRISIPKPYQPDFDVIPFGERGQPDRRRITGSVFSTGDFVIVWSFGKVPESVIAKIRRAKSRYWETQEYKEAVAKYSKSDHLVFNKDRYIGELEYGIGPIGFETISSSNGYFWVQRRYEDERDYKTFLKVRIVPEN